MEGVTRPSFGAALAICGVLPPILLVFLPQFPLLMRLLYQVGRPGENVLAPVSENDQVLFDPRTVLVEQEETFLQNLKQVWNDTRP